MTDRYRNTPINQIPANVPVNIPQAADYQFPSYETMTSSILPPIGADPLPQRSLSARSMPESGLPLWMVPFAAMAGMGNKARPKRTESEVMALVRKNRENRPSVNVDWVRSTINREFPDLYHKLRRGGGSYTQSRYLDVGNRQLNLPLEIRNNEGALNSIGNPRYTFRFNEVNPHPFAIQSNNNNTYRSGRFHDTSGRFNSLAPSSVYFSPTGLPFTSREGILDRLRDISNRSTLDRGDYRPRPPKPNQSRPSINEDLSPDQLSFLRALLGE